MSRCWAYSKDKVRCELDAGHDDLHRISAVWSDSECYEPEKTFHTLIPTTGTTTTAITTTIAPPPTVPPPPPADPADVRCVACSHRHRAGECKCGCKEFIG